MSDVFSLEEVMYNVNIRITVGLPIDLKDVNRIRYIEEHYRKLLYIDNELDLYIVSACYRELASDTALWTLDKISFSSPVTGKTFYLPISTLLEVIQHAGTKHDI